MSIDLHPETAVLGACVVDETAYWKIADAISAEDFSEQRHRELFTTIGELARSNQPFDAVTIAEKNEALGRTAMLVANASYYTRNVRAYAEILVKRATARRVIAAGQRIAKLSGEDVLGEAQRILAACQPRTAAVIRSIGEFMRDSTVVMQARCDATDVITGVATSLDWLDENVSGWQRGDLIVVAARPSVGKTAFALQCAIHAANAEHPVFFASLEQSGTQIAERATAHISGVSLQHITQPKRMTDSEWELLATASKKLDAMPISIDESGALTAEAICARVRQVNAQRRLGLVVIDYLQQITPPRADKVADGIQMITRALKALAKELSLPIILLSQLNREGEDKPVLKNLRDSGAIEQDADIVIFLHRPDQHRRELIELIIAKHRNGPTDQTYIEGLMSEMRFISTTKRPSVKKAGWGTTAQQEGESNGSR
jgi:replicative DNA helicase